jgi:hypothetical protein
MMEQSGGLKVIVERKKIVSLGEFINHDVLQAQYGGLNTYARFKTPDGKFNIMTYSKLLSFITLSI